jgi:GNAT superfamily N-acetyltransferase
MNITNRNYEEQDILFFQDCVKNSIEWQKEECSLHQLSEYMMSYEHLHGRWIVWLFDCQKVGISYTVNESPSNGRPWVGTLLVEPGHRKSGVGSKIMEALLEEWGNDGHKVAYAAIPIMQQGWSTFLSKCGFEQYKLEKEEGHTYLLFVKPLEKE